MEQIKLVKLRYFFILILKSRVYIKKKKKKFIPPFSLVGVISARADFGPSRQVLQILS